MTVDRYSDVLLQETLAEALTLHAYDTRVPAFGAIAMRARRRRHRRTALAAVVAAVAVGGVSVAATGLPTSTGMDVATPAQPTAPAPASDEPTASITPWAPEYRTCTGDDVVASLVWTDSPSPARGLLRLRGTGTDACDARGLFAVPLNEAGQELSVKNGPGWADDNWEARVLDQEHDVTAEVIWPSRCGSGGTATIRLTIGPDHLDVHAATASLVPCHSGSTHRFEISPPLSVPR
jgi:hypothetical protein